MIPVVLDCNVLVSAIGWGGNPRLVLDAVFSGLAEAIGSDEIWREYEERVPEILLAAERSADPIPVLGHLLALARFVEPVPLGRRRSRDAKDDPYIATALAGGACIVTNDRDLLDMGKPFGVPILTPAEFLRTLRESGRR